jgi:nucleoside-diphosphate-sugar epimerase/predicted dehydrogenase
MHVLVEKPLASSLEDCAAIAAAAAERNVSVCVDHSLLFDPEIVRARRIVRSGALGRVIGVDIIRSSEYPPFAGGSLPAHYADAGEPFRDLGVHALYLVREFLGEIRGAAATHHCLGGDPLLAFDEWCCTVDCDRGVANIRLSWNARPLQSILLIHGTRGMLRVDLFHMFLSMRRERSLPKAAVRIINTVTDSLRPLLEMPLNTLKFMTGRRRQYAGIHGLVCDFYSRLGRGEPPAVSVADATAVVRWTEQVARKAQADFIHWNDRHPVAARCDVLVTGGGGKLGGVIVSRLAARGLRVRVLSRRPPQSSAAPNVEYVVGDLGDALTVDRAVRGAKSVVHAGATMAGNWDRFRGGTIVGTGNLLESMARAGAGRLVHISSLSVLDWAGSDRGDPVDENTADEPRPALRGGYTRSKLEAEHLVRAAAAAGRVDAVILRPGQIFGGPAPILTPAVCRLVGPLNLVLGDGRLRLPLVHIDDVVTAIEAALVAEIPSGTVIHLVDPGRHTQNEVIGLYASGRPTLRIPRTVVFGLGWLSEKLLGLLGRESPFSVYRLRSALPRLEFQSERARELLGWHPCGCVLQPGPVRGADCARKS